MSSPQEIAMRLLEGGAGGSKGVLRAVIDDDISSLIITAGNGAEDESHGVYNYAYETFEISDSITMRTTSGDITTTTTKNFSAELISKLYSADGDLIFRAECGSKGKIKGFFDKDNNKIHTEKFEIHPGEGIGISGADAPAIAWCMAKNSERSSALLSQSKAYKDGFMEADETGREVIELEEDIPDGVVDYDVDLDSTLFDEDSDGMYLKYIKPGTTETCYVHIYNNGQKAIDRDSGFWYGTGRLTVEVIDNGTLVYTGNPYQNVNYRSGVFKPGKDGYSAELITGIKICTDHVDVELAHWGWSYKANSPVQVPWWHYWVNDMQCVNISTSVPVDLQ